MATKSTSSPQTATSLASPVAVPAARASLPALAKAVPTPGLKAQPAPPHRPKPRTTATQPASTPTVSSTPTVVHTPPPPPPPPRTTPTTGVVHNPGGSTSNGVVHGGQ